MDILYSGNNDIYIVCFELRTSIFYLFLIVSFQPLHFWQTFDFVCSVCGAEVGSGRCFFGTLLESKLTRISYSTSWFDPSNPLSSLPMCWQMTSVNGSVREVWVGELGLVLEEGEIKSNKKGIYIVKHRLKTEHQK